MSEYLLEARNLKKYFRAGRGLPGSTEKYIRAVDDVSLTVKATETLGIVGESGCGKSTLARMLMKIYPPTSGSIIFEGNDITHIQGKALHDHRKNIQMVFQDPYSSLNPKMRVGNAIAEPLWSNGLMSRKEAQAEAIRLLEAVGLEREDADKFPFQFSGGQRQRICIARAIGLKPKLIIADEAVSALDVSVQAQILNLLMDLRDAYSLSYIFISHNLAVIEHICDEIIVMYLGRVVEKAGKSELWLHPLHPYTKALFSAAPVMDRSKQKKAVVLEGDVPNPANPPSGCPFHTRCLQCTERCKTEEVGLKEIRKGHFVACHLAQPGISQGDRV